MLVEDLPLLVDMLEYLDTQRDEESVLAYARLLHLLGHCITEDEVRGHELIEYREGVFLNMLANAMRNLRLLRTKRKLQHQRTQ